MLSVIAMTRYREPLISDLIPFIMYRNLLDDSRKDVRLYAQAYCSHCPRYAKALVLPPN